MVCVQQVWRKEWRSAGYLPEMQGDHEESEILIKLEGYWRNHTASGASGLLQGMRLLYRRFKKLYKQGI